MRAIIYVQVYRSPRVFNELYAVFDQLSTSFSKLRRRVLFLSFPWMRRQASNPRSDHYRRSNERTLIKRTRCNHYQRANVTFRNRYLTYISISCRRYVTMSNLFVHQAALVFLIRRIRHRRENFLRSPVLRISTRPFIKRNGRCLSTQDAPRLLMYPCHVLYRGKLFLFRWDRYRYLVRINYCFISYRIMIVTSNRRKDRRRHRGRNSK